MNGVADWVVPLEGVEVEAGQVHVLGGFCGIKTVQPPENAFVEPGVDLGLSGFPQGFQLIVAERLNYMSM